MTFSLSAIRDDIEADLRDSSNLAWSTAEIDRGIAQALGRYAHAAPREVTATLTDISSRTIDLAEATPSGLGDDYAALICVEGIEYPTGVWPPTWVRFDAFGTAIVLHADSEPVNADVKLYYVANHTLDADDGTIPDRDRELLAIGAAAYCLRQRTVTVAETLNNAANVAPTLASLARDRMDLFEQGLARLRRRVRQRQRYAPEPPYLNRDTVQGPP